jgi:hypothetical protein
MLLVLFPLAEAGPLSGCAQTWDTQGLLDAVASADLSTAKMDAAGLLAARDRVLVRLGCVTEPLSGSAIGGVHRIVATAASLEHQDTRIAPALAGMLAADPGYQLPAALYPEGHPIRGLLSHAGILLRDPGERPLLTPPSGWLEVDGQHADAAPLARPAVIQQIDGDGAVVETRYVWPSDDLGRWAAAPDAAPTPRPHALRVPLLAATAAGVVATGVLYGVAAADNASFHDESIVRTEPELATLRNSTNGLTLAWIGVGAASLGLGVGLVLSW